MTQVGDGRVVAGAGVSRSQQQSKRNGVGAWTTDVAVELGTSDLIQKISRNLFSNSPIASFRDLRWRLKLLAS